MTLKVKSISCFEFTQPMMKNLLILSGETSTTILEEKKRFFL
jgi:hypothetical protein